jgi:ribulose-phosphate 3-epimerase
MTEIVPAILTNDVEDFRKKYAELFALSHYFTKLHVDFIDGKFLPNKTILPGDGCRLKGHIKFIAHFMTLDPKRYFAMAKNEGYSTVLFHLEAFENESEILETIELARTLNLEPGLVINPETPVLALEKYIHMVSLFQLMSVHPGKQGGKFISETLQRIKELRKLSKNAIICVDGGIKIGVAHKCAQAGANQLVAGSAILKAEDEEAAIEALKEDIETK